MKQRCNRLPCFVLSLLTVGAVVPQEVRAGATTTQPASAKALDVQVEVTLGEADEQKLAASVREAIVDRVRSRDIEISDDAPSTLLVSIGWVGKSRSDLEVRYVVRKGEGEPETLKTSVCPACGSGEVIAAIDGDLAPLWAKIDGAAAIAPTPAEPASTTVVPAPAPVTTDDRTRPRRTIGPMGLAGVAIGAVGIGALAAGAVMWRVEYRYPEDNPDIRKNLKQPGIALVAAGSALTIAGVVMTAVDLSRGKRAKKVAMSPTFDRRQVGVALAVRW
jgi:hypothetical protein